MREFGPKKHTSTRLTKEKTVKKPNNDSPGGSPTQQGPFYTVPHQSNIRASLRCIMD